MRIVYAGTPEFAAVALEALISAGHDIALVLTQPDRPAGRGLNLTPSPVKQLAERHGLSVFQPPGLREPAAQQRIRDSLPEVMVVAAYGLILPPEVLRIAPHGAVNIHASLLPRWRGAAPIQRAIQAGDPVTGISIMQMEAGLDTGPILAKKGLPIESRDTAASLHDKLAALGAAMILDTMRQLAAGPLEGVEQPQEGVCYASKITKAEAGLDWRMGATQLERNVRAFNPHPGAHAVLRGVPVKIWRATPVDARGGCGVVLKVGPEAIVVGCGIDGGSGPGALALGELQRPGGKRLAVAQFLQGFPVVPGERFEPLA